MSIKQPGNNLNPQNLAEKLEAPFEGVFSFKELLEKEKISKDAHKRLLLIGEELKKEEFKFLEDLKKEFGDEIDVCLVGGMVRDAVLNKEAKDYDFIVSFCGSRFKSHKEARDAFEIFMEKGEYGKINLVGRDFGVYKLNVGGDIGEIDISFPRTETVSDKKMVGVHDNFDVQSDALLPAKEDLGRRDLDINAMALRIKNLGGNGDPFEFLDTFNGLDSISKDNNKEERGKIRAVGNPEERFREDLSRILRAVRFATKFNYEIDPPTWQAIEKLVGEGFLNKTYKQKLKNEKDKEVTTERFFIPRETLSVEICKAFVYNPEEAIGLMRYPINVEGRESSILEEIMPELFNETRLTKKQLKCLSPDNKKSYLEKFGENKDGKQVVSEPDEQELNNSRAIKEAALDRAVHMYKLARERGLKLSQEEIFAILFHNAGQTEKLAEAVDDKRIFYPMSEQLSRIYWEETYSSLKMMSFRPQDRRFMVSGTDVNRIINNIPSVFGLLNGKNGNGNDAPKEYSKKTLGKIYDYFPQGVDDSLYKVLELDIESTNTITDNTRENYKELGRFLQKNKNNLESEFGPINENFNKILTTTDILEVFHIKQGPLFRQLITAAKNNYYKYLSNTFSREEDYSEERAREIMFTTIINRPEARAQLRGLATESLYENMFRDEWGNNKELVKEYPDKPGQISNKERFIREVMALIENRIYKDYIGKSIDNSELPKDFIDRTKTRVQEFRKIFLGLAKNNPKLLQTIIESDIKKQGKGKFLINGEIVSGPDKVKGQPKEYDSFFDIILPEITNLYRVEQSKKFHAEGDVLTHTFLSLESAIKLEKNGELKFDDELTAAVLLHDKKKSEAISVNKRTGNVLMAGHENIENEDIEPVLAILNISEDKRANIKRAIKNHMSIYTKWRNLETHNKKFNPELTHEIYNLFPSGTKDLLYKVMLCDANGSINDKGQSQYETSGSDFSTLKEILMEIDKINGVGIEFKEFLKNKDLKYILNNPEDKKEAFMLFKEYYKFLVKKKSSSSNTIEGFFKTLLNDSPVTGRLFLNRYYNLRKTATVFVKINEKGKAGESKKSPKKISGILTKQFLTDEKVEKYLEGDYRKLNIEEEFKKWLLSRNP